MAEFRTFETGATRDGDNGKLDYEGFISPLVLRRFAEFMHKNRFLRDGSMRDSDNWQKGIPLKAYMKSGWRHFMDWWLAHRGVHSEQEFLEEALCALIFNAQGYLHEVLKTKGHTDEENPPPPAPGPPPPSVQRVIVREGRGAEPACRE